MPAAPPMPAPLDVGAVTVNAAFVVPGTASIVTVWSVSTKMLPLIVLMPFKRSVMSAESLSEMLPVMLMPFKVTVVVTFASNAIPIALLEVDCNMYSSVLDSVLNVRTPSENIHPVPSIPAVRLFKTMGSCVDPSITLFSPELSMSLRSAPTIPTKAAKTNASDTKRTVFLVYFDVFFS